MTRRFSLGLGFTLSLALGLFLATVVFGIVWLSGGNPKERQEGYCSEFGKGAANGYVARPEESLIYVSSGLEGFPPRERCRVYAVDYSAVSGPYLLGAMSEDQYLTSSAAGLRHRLLQDETYPGAGEYTWILGALLLPLAPWCVLAIFVLRGCGTAEIRQRQHP